MYLLSIFLENTSSHTFTPPSPHTPSADSSPRTSVAFLVFLAATTGAGIIGPDLRSCCADVAQTDRGVLSVSGRGGRRGSSSWRRGSRS